MKANQSADASKLSQAHAVAMRASAQSTLVIALG
jgi:hypothetical protein